jgi:hypothetical protein
MGWEREKPDWFTDNWKAKVPVDWVPKEGKAEHRKARESVRKASVMHVPRLSRASAGVQGAVASINGSAKKISGVFNSGKKLVLVREEEEEEEEEEEKEERKARERSVAERGRKGSVLHASAKQLVSVAGGGGGEGPKSADGGGSRRDAEDERGSAEAVRGGSRVQPVIR